MFNLTDIGTIKSLLEKNGIVLTKARGQNFLINPSVCPQMAEFCGGNEADGVLEIGPGVGVLTEQLAKIFGKVVSIELDKGLLPVLDETLAEYDNVKIVPGDALKIDLKSLIKEEFEGKENIYLCANLPYNVTTPIIMSLLENKMPLKKIVVMVQKEFAQRLCSPVGSRESGAVTVSCAYYAKAERVFGVSSGSFFPPPKVDSEVICLTPYEKPPVSVEDEKLFFKIIKAGFSQRRKTMQNSLFSGLGIEKTKTVSALEKIGLSPTARIEELDLEQLAEFSNILR